MSSANNHGTVRQYITGFILSLAITITAYFLVSANVLSGTALGIVLVELAVAQLFVQLIFFLHIGRQGKSYWHLVSFAFASVVIAILVFGSLWIMYNLDYHMMPSTNVDQHIMEEEGIHK